MVDHLIERATLDDRACGFIPPRQLALGQSDELLLTQCVHADVLQGREQEGALLR